MQVELVLLKKDGSRKGFPLHGEQTIIGRRQDCELCIPLMAVSRCHCQLTCSKDTLVLRDLGSTNGTYVNGKPVAQTELQPGDYIQIGPVVFAVRVNGQPQDVKMPPAAILRTVKPSEQVSKSRAGPPDRAKTGPGKGPLSESQSGTELLDQLQ
jgi:pSer/pThr/pTyr-binding forkhead associated (FHA) protein